MIDSKDISVVIQGPIFWNDAQGENITQKCCARVRELLPNSEIILSTWEKSRVENIEYDVVIFNKDPGGIPMVLNGVDRINNTNRMLVSTINGIKASKRKYLIKMRTDIYIENLNFIDKFGLFPITNKYSLIRERIVSLSANHPKRGAEIVFTISDWFEFGYTEDIRKLWSIPLQSENCMVEQNGKKDWKDNMVAESYIWPQFLKKDCFYREYLIKYDGVIPVNKDTINMSEKSLADFVVLYEGYQLGLNSLKYWNKNYVRKDFARASCYMHFEWEKLYRKYCNLNYKPKRDIKGIFSLVQYVFVFEIIQKKFGLLYQKLKKIYTKLC